MLEYQNEIFLETLSEDGLLILAKGLGIEEIFLSLLRVYCDPGNLVLVLGANAKEAEYFIEELDSKGLYPLPKTVTAEYSIKSRQNIYNEGGVIFVTSRILVVDFLMDRVPAEHITGVFIYKAHRVMEFCQEAFILRLYRQRNKTGFIKAVSASPLSFLTGFCHVTRVMRSLFVKNLYIWPRFHKLVSDSLKASQADVEEIRVTMTSGMLTLQTCIMDLVNSTIQELKRVNPALEADNFTVENAISKSWHKILSQELDPVWHQLSSKTRQLVADLKTLRSLLIDLCRVDSITFYMLVSSLRTTERALKCGGWMLLDSAETLFVHSKRRVFEGKGPEVNPKWLVLAEILEEIRQKEEENRKLVPFRNVLHSTKILVLTEDDRTALQIKEMLTQGVDHVMDRLLKALPDVECKNLPPRKVSRKTKESYSDSSEITLTQIANKYDKNSSEQGMDEDAFRNSISSPITLVHSMRSMDDPVRSLPLLHDIEPDYIIMYDAEISFVRHIEVWKAAHPKYQLKVYFVMYQDSCEEQAYLTSLRREKCAFEHLIQEKASMVIPEYQDGKSDDHPALKCSKEMVEKSTRKGGKEENEQLVIVDMREFRCELPSLIHRRGIIVQPVTLQVGDYILSPEICVERKTLSDLIGSLKSGRLYNQALAMTRSYKKPVLLIEFPHDKPFTLSQGRYYLSNDVNSSEFVSKLQLLTLHFPSLRILWSPGCYATAEIFHELKIGQEQPDVQNAQNKCCQELPGWATSKYNPIIYDFVSKLPGVHSKNQHVIMNKVKDLCHLLSFSLGDIEALLENSKDAEKLWKALHENITDKTEPAVSTKGKRYRRI